MSKPNAVRNILGSSPQRGSALIIALVFLLIMTLIGTTAMQGTSQQENMAGNMRDRNLAFQAAEAALRAGERDALATANPLLPPQVPAPNNTGVWWTNFFQQNPSFFLDNTATAPTGPPWRFPEVSQQPSYVVENMNNVDVICLSDPSRNCYRITARGVGGTPNAVVILQATLSRSIP